MSRIEILKELISLNKEGWKEIETRRDLFQFNHYMRFFDVIDIDQDLFKDKEYKTINFLSSDSFELINNDFFVDIQKRYNSYIGKAYLVKLLPQKYPSRQYYDSEEYEDIISKLFIPILVNSKNSFCVNDKILYPNPNEEIFIENDSLVAVYNLGETEIVYFSIDLIPADYFDQI
jgi:hypothetical protein